MNRVLTRQQGMSFETVIAEFQTFLREEKHPVAFDLKPKLYAKLPRTKHVVFDKDHSEVAALILSDWHGSETVRYEESNGINRYNSRVMANRVWAVVEKFKRIVRGHQAMYSIEKLWVMVLGDMIHGSIHPENILTNDLLDVPAAILVSRILIAAFEELKALGLPIEADCTVGNHPRIALLKMPTKRQAHTSFDWIIYTMLANHFEHDEQVTVRVHTGQFGIVDMLGHRCVVEHGYGASGQQDMVAKIRAMFDSPVYRNATGMTGTSVDFLCIGDKHRAQLGEGYIVNGCLSGSNELGTAWRLSPIGAIQQCFGLSKRKIPTWTYPLDVSNVQSEGADNPMGTYANTFMVEHGR